MNRHVYIRKNHDLVRMCYANGSVKSIEGWLFSSDSLLYIDSDRLIELTDSELLVMKLVDPIDLLEKKNIIMELLRERGAV